MRPYWTLRVGAALCFIGHGAFGFITKAAWVPYFAVVGIPEAWAWRLMPLVGAVDVLAGMAVLFGRTRLPLLYMTVWAAWTAMLRPLSGESVFETLERAGNYGVPLALLLWVGIPRLESLRTVRGWRDVFSEPSPEAESVAPRETIVRVLQWTTVILLAGHGALGIMGKPMLATHYASIGLPDLAMPIVGWFEIALAASVALRRSATLLVFVVIWKLATESLFFLAGAPIWEFVERAGSYAAPAALAMLLSVAPRRLYASEAPR